MRRQVRGTLTILGTHVSGSLASSGPWHPVAKWTSPPVGRIASGSPAANTESIAFPQACLSSRLPHFWARCFGVMGRAAFQEAEALRGSLHPSSVPEKAERLSVKFGKNKVHSRFPFIPGRELLSPVPLHRLNFWISSSARLFPGGTRALFWGSAYRPVWLSPRAMPPHLTFIRN